MKRIIRLVISSGSGAAACGLLSSAAFVIFSVIDGSRLDEALGFGLVVGVLSGLLGALIGLAAALLGRGVLPGGLIGFLATLAVAACYVLIFGRSGRYLYFLRASGPIFYLLALPAVLAGMLSAWVAQVSERW